MTLRQAAQAAYDHATNDPLSRLDQPQLTALRRALDAPNIADELADVLRSVVHECDAVFVDVSEMSPEWRAIEANARAVLARYDAQKPEIKPCES